MRTAETGRREGYVRLALGGPARDGVDTDGGLLRLTDHAWSADYRGEVRLLIEQTYLRRMSAGAGWIGTLVCTEAGEPVGLELGVERTLHLAGTGPLSAYYVSAFSVSPAHRRRGIGRWVLEGINQLAFEQRGADLVFSAFHVGHAGSPTVQSTFDAIEGHAVRRFTTQDMYGLRFEHWQAPALPRAEGTRVTRGPHGALHAAPGAASAGPALPGVAALEEAVAARHGVSFGLDRTFAELYLGLDDPDAGSLWYTFADGAECWLLYSVVQLAQDSRQLGSCGQLHAIHRAGCSHAQVQSAVLDLAHRFAAHGRGSMIALDGGALPVACLERIGLAPVGSQIAFAVRGPAATVERFSAVAGPHFIDLL